MGLYFVKDLSGYEETRLQVGQHKCIETIEEAVAVDLLMIKSLLWREVNRFKIF